MPENQKLCFNWLKLFNILKQDISIINEQSLDIKLKYEWIQKLQDEINISTEEIKKIQKNDNDKKEKELSYKEGKSISRKYRKVK